MPYKKIVHDLKDICIKLIVKELTKIRSSSQLTRYGKRRIQSFNEKFQYFLLPDNLMQDIYSCLEKAESINEFNLQLFIRKDMKTMLLTNSSPTILYLIKSLLPVLETLEISRNCEFICKDIYGLAVIFPNLIRLNISYTNADNSVMDIILKTCTNLKFLNISFTKILNMPFIRYTFKNNTVPLACQNLLYLDIRGLELKSRSYEIILRLFPYLEILESFRILLILKDYSSQTNNISNLQLRKINSYEEVCSQDLANICRCCPYVQQLTLHSFVWKHEPFEILSQYFNLKDLYLHLSHITSNIINKFLSLCGSKITKLRLFSCEVDVFQIIKFCPNVKRLELNNSYLEYSLTQSFPPNSVSKLTEIYVEDNITIEEITCTIIMSFLQFCCKTIESLSLNEPALKNEDVKLILQNDWRSLKVITFMSMKNLCEDVLDMIILNTSIPLEQLTIEKCPKITNRKIKRLKQVVSNLNLDLKINYFAI